MMSYHLVSRQGPPMGPPPSPEYLAESIQSNLLAVSCSLFAIAMVAVLMRYYVRIFMLKMFGWDDIMMLIAAALSITCEALFIRMVQTGMGTHAEAMAMRTDTAIFWRYLYFYALFIIFAYSFVKFSIGFFLLRLADRTRWRRFLQGVLVFLVFFTLGSTLAIIFQCIPVQAGWDFSLRPPTGTAKCYDGEIFKNIGVFNSSVNIATDLLFAIIPIPMIWKLQVNMRTKVGLGVILGLGFFASAIAIYKTPMQYNFFKVVDWSYDGAWYYIWQQVELQVGITAACLPTLKPLFANFFGHIRTLTSGSKGRSTGGLSAPFKSNGYLKQNDDPSGNRSGQRTSVYAMKPLSEGSASRSGPRSPYDITKAGESDESILEHGNNQGLQPKGRVIIRTTEFDVR